ncbi:MAG: hypothetical protein NC311_15795, partial [Muribaculaceae bacterium]|nr:hypothetical protein [Muribaculaceae bacterium]
DRTMPTPEYVEGIEYSQQTSDAAAGIADVKMEAMDVLNVGRKNDAHLTPYTDPAYVRYGSVDIGASEMLSVGATDDKYAGSFNLTIKDANNFTTPTVKAGEGFVVALKSDGSVWAWGDNTYGQLGIGYTGAQVPYTTYPAPVKGLNNTVKRLNLIEEIAVGYHHVLARTSDGSVYAWGDNSRGQIGRGDDGAESYYYPVQVMAGNSKLFNEGVEYLVGATSLAAGALHSMALLGNSDGYIYSWGDNSKSQLGSGYNRATTGMMRNQPSQVINQVNATDPSLHYLSGAHFIAAGAYHSLAVGQFPSTGGTVSDATSMMGWGDNTYGQLGFSKRPMETDPNTKEQFYYVYAPDQAVYGVPPAQSVVSGIVKVAAGERHTILISGTGATCRVRVMGDNSYYQLGNTTAYAASEIDYTVDLYPEMYQAGKGMQPITDAIDVAAGRFFSIVLRGTRDANGNVVSSEISTFGYNSDGQLGKKPQWEDPDVHNAFEANIDRARNIIPTQGVDGVITSVAAGSNFGMALSVETGDVFGWGGNATGQLGEFSLVDRSAAAEVGFEDAWIPKVAGVINYGGSMEYPVTIAVELDHKPYPSSQPEYDYKLVLNTPTKTEFILSPIADESGEGRVLYSNEAVKGGSYSVWAAKKGGGSQVWEDTGADVKVSKGIEYAEPTIVDFFTLKFEMKQTNLNGTASTLTAIYDGQSVKSGDVVWGNKKLVITAVGQNGVVDDYDYYWIDAVAGSKNQPEVPKLVQREGAPEGVMNGVYTIETLHDYIELTCTIEGPTTHDTGLSLYRDDSKWRNSGKVFYLVSKYAAVKLTDDGTGFFGAEQVPNGSYAIIDGEVEVGADGRATKIVGYDTGRTMLVGNNAPAVDLDYYTVDYDITPTGGVSWAKIDAYYAVKSINETTGRTVVEALTDYPIGKGEAALKDALLLFQSHAVPRFNATYKPEFDWSTGSGLAEAGYEMSANNDYDKAYTVGVTAAELHVRVTSTAPTNTVNMVRFTLNGKSWDDRDDSVEGEVTAVSTWQSTSMDAQGATWATYPLAKTADGNYAGNVPQDDYQIYVNGQPLKGILVNATVSNVQAPVANYSSLSYYFNLDNAVSASGDAVFTVESVDVADTSKIVVLAEEKLNSTSPVDSGTATVAGTVNVPAFTGVGLIVRVQGGDPTHSYDYFWNLGGSNMGDNTGVPGTSAILATSVNVNGLHSAGAPDRVALGDALEIYVYIEDKGLRAGGFSLRDETAAVMETEPEDVTEADEDVTVMDTPAPTAGEGEIVHVHTEVTGREPVSLAAGEYDQSDLLLGSEIELVSGDTVDITGTIEEYISDFRLRANKKDNKTYINTTANDAGAKQPYLDMPKAEYGPEGNITNADVLANTAEAMFIITSSNPKVVSVKGYTLTAGESVGKAIVRIYNQTTKRSVMLSVHVINVEDSNSSKDKYIYRSTPAISLGDTFSVALKADGSVWTWGDNGVGQLGIGQGAMTYSDSPVRVVDENGAALTDIIAIAAGADHAVAVDRFGTVYSWGNNNCGQLGIDPAVATQADEGEEGGEVTTAVVTKASAVILPTDGIVGQVVDVAAGKGFTLMLTDRNTVWGIGRNDKGQLGAGYTNDVVGYDPVRAQIPAKDLQNEMRTEPEPFYMDSLFLYETYLYELINSSDSFINQMNTPEIMQEYYWKPETGEISLLAPEYAGNEMPSYDAYLEALKMYEAALVQVGDFKPIIRVKNGDWLDENIIRDET